MAEFTRSVDIEAAPETVFDHLVTAEGLTAWMGEHAEIEPHADGRFAVDIAGYPIRGRYVVVDRPHRVVVTWGVAGSADLPPGASRVEFVLHAIGTGTRVELTHADLPETDVAGHADGWRHFLPRLRTAAGGGRNDADHWVPLGDRDPHPSERSST